MAGTTEELQRQRRAQQADFLAGVWARHNQRYLERGDIEEALRAANQLGDDAIQARTQGKVVPHAFTHGTSEPGIGKACGHLRRHSRSRRAGP
ncbi:MAG: hypothetical protein GWP60_05785 [Gammaproteobacteria bacterium]|jgi:predicted metalloprotease|nr:hypothetical protein [Gammaproteobacteria bacterium]